MKARNRPPRLEPAARADAAPSEPTLEQRMLQARIAGRGTVGPTELRHLVERAPADAMAPGVGTDAVWAAVHRVFGARPERAEILPDRVIAAARVAGARVHEAARRGERIVFATAVPATLLPLHLWLAERARSAGASLGDGADIGPLRVDGRTPRWLRFLDGVAVVTDGHSLLAVNGPEAPDELLFRVGRASLVVADGPFAAAARACGVEVVAFAGLERCGLAVPDPRRAPCTVVPVHPGRPPGAYELLRDPLGGAATGSASGEM